MFVFLTGGKTESPVSAQQCAAAILGMDRKPMVQTFFSAVKKLFAEQWGPPPKKMKTTSFRDGRKWDEN